MALWHSPAARLPLEHQLFTPAWSGRVAEKKIAKISECVNSFRAVFSKLATHSAGCSTIRPRLLFYPANRSQGVHNIILFWGVWGGQRNGTLVPAVWWQWAQISVLLFGTMSWWLSELPGSIRDGWGGVWLSSSSNPLTADRPAPETPVRWHLHGWSHRPTTPQQTRGRWLSTTARI